MKRTAVAICALICAGNALAGQRFDVAALKNVQTYDVHALVQQEPSLLGHIVAVRFHYRSEKLRHLKPNWYEAALWQNDAKAKKGFSSLRVFLEKKDVPAFQTIPSDSTSMTELTLYGRVETDPENNQTYLRVLGRKVATDAAGNATVGW
ncbi:MAG TPA: hypothetical protein VGW57_08580 [Chthoniobacterales bacterium]|nr:hypothetical protein [Chthoniobacterales bacterium]